MQDVRKRVASHHCAAFAADLWSDCCRCSPRTPLQGGGTFDISILEISGGVFEVRYSADTGSWRRHTDLWHACRAGAS